MRIPEVRDRLQAMAIELNQLVDELRRRPGKRTRQRNRTITPALAAAIRKHCRANPHHSQQWVGMVFKVNAGRVSEIMRGKRK